MDGNWWSRFGVILAALLVSLYALLPSFVGESAEERNRRKVEGQEDASAEVVEGWHSWLPDTRINLGIDLQGGIDLTLDVELEEAVLSTVARDVQSVVGAAESEGLALAEVRRVRGEPALELKLGPGTALDDARTFMATRFRGYEYAVTDSDAGGVEWHRFALTEDEQARIGAGALEQAVETLRTRVDATGVKEPSITQKGDRRINVQLPGEVVLEDAVAALGTTAVLEFYLVDHDFDDAALARAVEEARVQLPADVFEDDLALNDWLVETGRVGRNNKILWEYAPGEDGVDVRAPLPIALIDEVMLTGDDINDAAVGMDEYNRPITSLEFKPRGAQIFAEVTGANIKKRFAIVLDNQIRSAPTIQDRISGGRAQITMGTGDYDQALRESQTLALVLRTGALPAPIAIAEVRTIGPTLGRDSIAAGVKASLIGSLMVVLSMALYYRRAGLVADVALAINVTLMLALLAGFGATLTLPGIAGIALTVGMAVDANIIIYERIREELRLGKSTRSAVEAGFDSALSAVLDANITTGIAGIVLYSYGTGPIRGFAVTLLIGIVTTLFTAIFVTRTLIDLVASKSDSRLVY